MKLSFDVFLPVSQGTSWSQRIKKGEKIQRREEHTGERYQACVVCASLKFF